jgi:Immunity protein 26
MNKKDIPFGSVFEIPLPDGRFAYGCWFKEVIVGIYNVISKQHLDFNKVKSLSFKAYKGCNDVAIKKKKWPIIGTIPLDADAVYPPDLAYYLPWLPEDSVERSEVNRKGQRTSVKKEYYLSLVKKGYTSGVFNKPEMLAEWIIEHLENWPDYEMPT